MKAKRPRKPRRVTEEEKDACGRAALVAMREVLRSGKWEMEMDQAARVYLYALALSAGNEAAESAIPEGVDRYLGLNEFHILASAILSIEWPDEDLKECSHYAAGAIPWIDLCNFAVALDALSTLGGALDSASDGTVWAHEVDRVPPALMKHLEEYGRTEEISAIARVDELLRKRKIPA